MLGPPHIHVSKWGEICTCSVLRALQGNLKTLHGGGGITAAGCYSFVKRLLRTGIIESHRLKLASKGLNKKKSSLMSCSEIDFTCSSTLHRLVKSGQEGTPMPCIKFDVLQRS